MIGYYFRGEERFEYDVQGLIGSFFPGEGFKKLPGPLTKEQSDKQGFSLIYPVPLPNDALPYAEVKNDFKRRVYDELKLLTGRDLPWGGLTGIRPTKLILELLEAGQRPVEIAEHMRRVYYLDGEKLSLAISIAQRERPILASLSGP